MKRNIKKIWAKYDDLALLEEDLQKVGAQECEAALENLPEDEKDEEYFYFKGFIHYMSEPSDNPRAVEFFRKALEIKPDHGHARLYLGHSLYDSGFYKEAENNFLLVEIDEFDDIVRDLIKMKVEEMIVCCQLKEDGLNKTTTLEAIRLINKYRKVDYHDDYLFNLSNALKEHGTELEELALKNLKFRKAAREDLPEIVRMLADDFLGSQRERYVDPLPESYVKAFEEIDADKNNELVVVEADGAVVGTLQLTFTPSISFQGGKRATVESVRVDEKYRGLGIGRALMLYAIERARTEGCISMQLTTNAERTDAHRFYENLGFKKSHLGMKLAL